MITSNRYANTVLSPYRILSLCPNITKFRTLEQKYDEPMLYANKKMWLAIK